MEKLKEFVYQNDNEGFVEHPTFYDINIDGVRKVTQKDFDELLERVKLLSMREKVVKELFDCDLDHLAVKLDNLREASDRASDSDDEVVSEEENAFRILSAGMPNLEFVNQQKD